MIHPNTEVRFVNPTIGYGVFATTDIPCGTIIYVKDRLDIELSDKAFHDLDAEHRAIAGKYSYIDEHGVRILSWDNAKYMNHRCDCNSMSTGYGFEIAIRNIWKGEEICDDYGQFNLEEEIAVSCNCVGCRKSVRPDDLETYYKVWDKQIISALAKVTDVHQPLMKYMDADVKKRLRAYICGEDPYTSVLALRHHGKVHTPLAAPQGSTPCSPKEFNG